MLIVNRRVAIAGLLFASLAAVADAQDSQSAYDLTLVGLDGKRTILGQLPDSVFAPRISPDGKQIALELRDVTRRGAPPSQERIWIADLKHPDKRKPLPVAGTGRNWAPLWSRDGRRVIFLVSGGASADALWWRNADGTGDAEQLVDGLSAEGVTPDGRSLTFITLTGDRDYGISLIDLGSRTKSILIDRPRSEQHSSTVSPDGQWIAYASNETGRHEIWMEPLPLAPVARRYRMTTTGGSHPVWSPDGAHVYFDRDGQLYALDIAFEAKSSATATTLPPVLVPRAGEPRELPIRGFQQGYRRRQFDLMPDGKQFLMLFPRGFRN